MAATSQNPLGIREQALLVASWTHKANIAALTDIDTILSYDVTANWPV